MNGNKGDHPLTDILHWKTLRFSPIADALIVEIVNLGGRPELEKAFNLFSPPPLPAFEDALREMRDRLHEEAKARGWEV